MRVVLVVILSLLMTGTAQGCMTGDKYMQIPIGNFALPISNRPRPLFSLGQNIVEKGNVLGAETMIYLNGGKQRGEFANAMNLLYGFTDLFHVFVYLPAPVYRRVNGLQTVDLGDINIQGEYQFWTHNTSDSVTKATVFANFFTPTGVLLEPLPVDFSTLNVGQYNWPAFMAGGTFAYTAVNWYGFASFLGLEPFKQENIHLGGIFSAQCGIGFNLGLYEDTIKFLLLELYAVWQAPDIVAGVKRPNSGGKSFFIAPSFWYSTSRLIVQAGIDVPVMQRFTGTQAKTHFVTIFQITYRFR